MRPTETACVQRPGGRRGAWRGYATEEWHTSPRRTAWRVSHPGNKPGQPNATLMAGQPKAARFAPKENRQPNGRDSHSQETRTTNGACRHSRQPGQRNRRVRTQGNPDNRNGRGSPPGTTGIRMAWTRTQGTTREPEWPTARARKPGEQACATNSPKAGD